MDSIELTKKLISIPSFVDNKANEKEIGEFIFNFLKKFPYLNIEKQKIGNNRFNVIAKDKKEPKLLFICHIDTVEPKNNQLLGKIENNRLYGLGAYDMKGGTACVLDAIKEFPQAKGLALLFYCDEEYNFKGMEEFLKKYSFKPDLIISPEPTNLEIINGCKGVIEIYFRVKGKTGHAARPQEGKNSINGITNAVNLLKQELQRQEYQNPPLGEPTLNLAYLSGGLMKGIDKNEDLILGNRGNNIPDIAEAVLDIRTPSLQLNSKKIIDFLKINVENQGLELEKTEIRSDYKPMYVPQEKLKNLEDIIKKQLGFIKYGDIKQQGYFDGEMIWRKFNSPFACFGPIGGNAHGADEWVDIDSLNKVRSVFKSLIEKLCI